MPNHLLANSDQFRAIGTWQRDGGCFPLPICCSHLPFLTPGRASPDRYPDAHRMGGRGRRRGPDSPGRQPTSWLGGQGRRNGGSAGPDNTLLSDVILVQGSVFVSNRQLLRQMQHCSFFFIFLQRKMFSLFVYGSVPKRKTL